MDSGAFVPEVVQPLPPTRSVIFGLNGSGLQFATRKRDAAVAPHCRPSGAGDVAPFCGCISTARSARLIEMRVAYVSNPTGVNSNYRAFGPMRGMRDRGHDCDVNREGQAPFRMTGLVGSDVVHVHRYLMPEGFAAMRQLREAGVGIVWDNDDDIAAVPRSNPLYAKFGGRNARAVERALRDTFRLVHVVTTPSARLAKQYRALGARDVRVIENHVSDAWPGTSRPKHDGVVVVWLAGLEHQVDYQQLRLRETFERLLDAHDDLRIISIGLGLGLRSDRYEHIPRVEFPQLPRALAAADIGIAPLVDIPWNQARSNVKLKEYACGGLAWLASPVGAYIGMGEDQGGRLVRDDGWHDALDALIRDARRRRKLSKRAAKWVKRETIGKHIGEWEAVYRDAVAAARP